MITRTLTHHAALLRAVNVGGTGKLAMSDLRELCDKLGFAVARTYIASGNVVFRTSLTELQIVKAIGAALEQHMRKRVGVLVRNADELEALVAKDPFSDAPGNRVLALLLPDEPTTQAVAAIAQCNSELIELGPRAIYVNYGEGMGESKLRIPAAAIGTARDMNTIRRLAEMCREAASPR